MERNKNSKKLMQINEKDKLVVVGWKVKPKREYIDLFKRENKDTLV